jgi:hypothetical protein
MPRRKNSWAEELILAPWWVSAALALLAYVILPAVLPRPMVDGGLIGFIAFMLLVLSAVSALRSFRSSSLLTRHTTALNSADFGISEGHSLRI